MGTKVYTIWARVGLQVGIVGVPPLKNNLFLKLIKSYLFYQVCMPAHLGCTGCRVHVGSSMADGVCVCVTRTKSERQVAPHVAKHQ